MDETLPIAVCDSSIAPNRPRGFAERMHSKPLLLSFLTCDNIHVDPTSQKYTLLGLFSGLQAVQFPMRHPRMFLFIALSDIASGEHTAKLTLELPGQSPIFEAEQKFKSAGPLQRIQLVSHMQNTEFPHDGDYSFMLDIDDELLLVTSFPVRQLNLPAGMQQPPKPE
jgi:hypothetical protein